MRIFFRFALIGKENFPIDRSYIMAGNHVGSIEALLLVCFAPRIIEVLGAGDIPLDPKLAGFANLYGYIPINRGEIDQKGLKAALSVLENGGVLGIFPEGGIWDPKLKPAKIGVSWLSARSNSPVIPIGFVGVENALKHAFHFKFPRMKMIIGNPIYPDLTIKKDKTQKESLMDASNVIMSKISELLPKDYSESDRPEIDNQNKIKILKVETTTGSEIEMIFDDLEFFSLLIQHPVIMDVFLRNLHLPVKSLVERNKTLSIHDYVIGCEAILNFINDKPGFLPYRFGFDVSSRMKNGLENFHGQLKLIPEENYKIRMINF